MKFIAFFFFLIPIALAAQTKSDYAHSMARFQRFYNAGQGDSICAMFERPTDAAFLWGNEKAASALDEFGALRSFKFIGIDTLDPDKVYVFKTLFAKAGTKTTSLTLTSNNNLSTFRFITSSEGITQLLKKNSSK